MVNSERVSGGSATSSAVAVAVMFVRGGSAISRLCSGGGSDVVTVMWWQ